MEPEPARSRVPWWAFALLVVVVAFSVLFFFQTRDPMILIFGLIAATMVFLVALVVGVGGRLLGGVQVRCRACQALNPEAAKHCMQCGQKL